MSPFIVTITLLCHPEQSEGSVITLLSKKILYCVQDDRMITMLYAKTKSVLFKVDLFILRKSVLICVFSSQRPQIHKLRHLPCHLLQFGPYSRHSMTPVHPHILLPHLFPPLAVRA